MWSALNVGKEATRGGEEGGKGRGGDEEGRGGGKGSTHVSVAT